MKLKLKLSYIILAFLASALIASCGSKTSEPVNTEEHHEEENSVELTADQIKTAVISFGKIERKQISGTLKVNGVLDVPPQQMISISIPLGGFLKSTDLLQGSRVKKGELIAVIENPDFIQLQQDYLEAKSQFEFASADFERQQELAKENVNAQKALQQAKSTYQSWLARKNGLLAKLKLINIDFAVLETGTITSTGNVYSPISGYVTKVNVNIGRFANPSDILFEIVDTDHLHAELMVFEKDAPNIKVGQKVRFVLANETKERIATVHLLGREISADRTIRIHCHIDRGDPNLLPGTYLKAVVETGGKEVTALPDEAIIDFQGKKYLFIPIEGKQGEAQHFIMIEIQVGNHEQGYTEILLPEGFDDSKEIVVKGAYSILSKIKNSEEDEGH